MFRLGQKTLVAEITSALESEEGVFLISSPTGETLQISLEEGTVQVYQSAYLPGTKREDELWTIVKIGELT